MPRLTVRTQRAVIPATWVTSANAEFEPGDAVEPRVDEVVTELADDLGIRVEGAVAEAQVLVDGDHRATVAMSSDGPAASETGRPQAQARLAPPWQRGTHSASLGAW